MQVNIHCVGILPIYFPFLLAIEKIATQNDYKDRYKDLSFNFFIRNTDADNFREVNKIFNKNYDRENELHIILSGLGDYKNYEIYFEPLLVLISRVPLFGIANKEIKNNHSITSLDIENSPSRITPDITNNFNDYEQSIFSTTSPITLSTYGQGTTVYDFVYQKIALQKDFNKEKLADKLLKTEEFGIDDLKYLAQDSSDCNKTIAFSINPWLRDPKNHIIVYRPPEEFESFTNIFTEKYDKLSNSSRELLNEIIKIIDHNISQTYSFLKSPESQPNNTYKDILKEDIRRFYNVGEKAINSYGDHNTIKFSKCIKDENGNETNKTLKHICMWLPGMKCSKVSNSEIEYDEMCCYPKEGVVNTDNIDSALDDLIFMCSYYRIFGADYDVLAFPGSKERKTFHYDEMLKSKGQAELLPQLSHAIGTIISAAHYRLETIIKFTVPRIKEREYEFSGIVNSIGYRGDNPTWDIQKLSESSEFFNDLVTYYREANAKIAIDIFKQILNDNIVSVKDSFKIFFEYDDIINTIQHTANRLYEIRQTNKAILRMYDSVSDIHFLPNGEYSLKNLIYSSLIVSLQHFFSITIFTPETGNDTTYSDAKKRLWQNLSDEDINKELELWLKHNLFLNSSKDKEDIFNNWYKEYSKLESTVLKFDFGDVSDSIRFNTKEGYPIYYIFFQELFLNAFKYGDKNEEGKLEIKLSIMVPNFITFFEFQNSSKVSKEKKQDGKGSFLINHILNKKFHLTPVQNQNFVIENEGYFKITGERKND